MKDIAVFGGTFNPPTEAHEAVITACLQRPSLDEVWLMPSGERFDKPTMNSDSDRVAMLQTVQRDNFHDDPKLKVSQFELDLPRPTQTYKTVNALKLAYPQDRFWFVIGADTYQNMPTWEHGQELRDSLNILMIPRMGYELPGESDRIHYLDIFDAVMSGISSTQVRRRQAAGLSIKYLVSPAVEEYIRAHGLYNTSCDPVS